MCHSTVMTDSHSSGNARHRKIRVVYQLKDFVTKVAGFENWIAAYIRVRENQKRKNMILAGQKTKIED